MDNSSNGSSYLAYNDYNILDNRITRNLQELLSERNSEQKVYQGIFDKIREKLFIMSESDDIELTDSDVSTFTKKYNITQSQEAING